MENDTGKKTDRLKVLFLLPEGKGSAVYIRACNLARQLALRGHAVTLMAVSADLKFGSRSWCESGLRFIETPNFLHNIFGSFTRRLFLESGTGILDIVARMREILSGGYDIIQLFDHSLNVVVPFYLLRRRVKSRFVSDWCDIHHFDGGQRYSYGFRFDYIYGKLGFPFRLFSRFVEFDLRRRVDGVTAISRNLRDFAVQHGVARDKVSVVEGGADVDNVRPLSKAEARKRLGLPADGKIVGFMGTFQRDMDVVIRSFTILMEEIPDSYLLVIGTPFPWARKIAEDHGVAERYIEAGRCPDELLPYYLACTDVLALPLKDNLFNKTRWPNKIGEYMACGRPVVVSDVGDIADVVREYGIGLTTRNYPADFSCKLKTLLSNPVLAENMGNSARQLACDKYSWALQAAKLEDFYHYLSDSERVRKGCPVNPGSLKESRFMTKENNAAPTLSVVIPTWRRQAQLRALLDSLPRQTRLPDEIIVVCRRDDNESLDAVRDWAASSPLSSRHKVAKVSEEGHLPPLIAALDCCESDIFCQIDDDAIPREDWLSRLEADFRDPLAGGVGGTIYNHRGKDAEFTPDRPDIETPAKLSWFGRSGECSRAVEGGAGLIDADCFVGCNMAFRKAALEGSIDMNLNGGSAISYETDVALCVREKGYKLYYDPGVVVDHYLEPRSIASKRGWNARECFVYAHNLTYICLKHLPWYGKLGFFVYFFLGGSWGCPGPGTFVLGFCYGRPASFREQFIPSMKGRFAGIMSYCRMLLSGKKNG